MGGPMGRAGKTAAKLDVSFRGLQKNGRLIEDTMCIFGETESTIFPVLESPLIFHLAFLCYCC